MAKLLFIMLFSSVLTVSASNTVSFIDFPSIESSTNLVGDIEIEDDNLHWKISDRIEYGAIGEPFNFSGKYFLLQFGCGTECIGLRLIDLNSGKVIETSIPPSTSGSYCFQKNSSLVVITHQNIAYEWNNNKFIKVPNLSMSAIESCKKI